MGNVSEGTVYLFLDANFFDEENTEARWNGHCELGDGSHFEDGPEFVDAGEAVAWWRRRGATRIYIRLKFEETLWAGEGAPPIDAAKIGTFEFADHRGRPEGAKETLANMRRDFAERQASEDEASALEEGRRLTRRRESVDISIDELANRVGVSSHWLADIEAGTARVGSAKGTVSSRSRDTRQQHARPLRRNVVFQHAPQSEAQKVSFRFVSGVASAGLKVSHDGSPAPTEVNVPTPSLWN